MTKNLSVVFPEAKMVTLEELAVSQPGEGEVLIKTSCSMVSTGTEMTAFVGEYLPGSVWEKHFKYPYYPGYNNIGTVVETGAGTDKGLLGKKFATWGCAPRGSARFQRARFGILSDHFPRQDAGKCTQDGFAPYGLDAGSNIFLSRTKESMFSYFHRA